MIDGIPDRNVIDIKRLWGGSWAYGDTSHSDSNNINVHLAAITQTAPTGSQTADLKFTITGHGSDANYCNEFCSHNYQVMVNGSSVGTQTVWRNDCGRNELWPQSGTWLYERANWCPGALVYSRYNTLTGITAGSTFSTAVVIDSYISNGGASYTCEGTLIYYGPMNKTLDVTLEDVIAPTNDENHFRENPICGKPTIHVKNTGATTITAMDIVYGIDSMPMMTYNWSGSLASLAEADIVLPELSDLNHKAGGTAALTFITRIATVNGVTDADTTNNSIKTQFMPGSLLPVSFKVLFKTNNEAIAASSSVSETSWVIYDMSGAIVASRVNAAISSYYVDTVTLGPGCYKLVLYDSSCNGLYWWANASSVTGGTFSLRKLSGVNIPLHGYSTGGTYANDFGCGFTAWFYTDFPTGITELKADAVNMDVFPNPAQNMLNIDIEGMPIVSGTLRMTDALGRTVLQQKCDSPHPQINTSRLINGVYTVQFIDDNNTVNRLQTRVIIAQ